MMKFTWIGGPSFVLELGAFRIAGDPVLADSFELRGDPVRRLAPMPAPFWGALDLACITSSRADHFDASVRSALGTSTPLVCASDVAPLAVHAGFTDVRELAWNEEMRTQKGVESLVVTAVPARSRGGDSNGYFFRHECDGKVVTAYWTGDALWSDDIRQVQRRHGYSNLLILHAGDERCGDGSVSPSAKDAMQFIYRMQPNAIVCIHHGTFSHYNENVTVLEEMIGRTIYDRRLRRLREGESFEK